LRFTIVVLPDCFCGQQDSMRLPECWVECSSVWLRALTSHEYSIEASVTGTRGSMSGEWDTTRATP
jgi:hypothetical protein